MSEIDRLQSLPIVDRIVITVDMLSRLHKRNTEKGAILGLTRKLQDQAFIDKGKASAYKDTLVFVTKLFEPELREKLEAKGETSDDDSVQGRDTRSGQAVELGDDSGCDNQNISGGNS